MGVLSQVDLEKPHGGSVPGRPGKAPWGFCPRSTWKSPMGVLSQVDLEKPHGGSDPGRPGKAPWGFCPRSAALSFQCLMPSQPVQLSDGEVFPSELWDRGFLFREI